MSASRTGILLFLLPLSARNDSSTYSVERMQLRAHLPETNHSTLKMSVVETLLVPSLNSLPCLLSRSHPLPKQKKLIKHIIGRLEDTQWPSGNIEGISYHITRRNGKVQAKLATPWFRIFQYLQKNRTIVRRQGRIRCLTKWKLIGDNIPKK